MSRPPDSSAPATPVVPVSWGEAIDRLTILEIKSARMQGAALANVGKELTVLRRIALPVLAANAQAAALKEKLKHINETLWDIEDAIRGKEAASNFDEEFIALARSVYKNNDERGALKKQISLLLGSALMEEKSYRPAQP